MQAGVPLTDRRWRLWAAAIALAAWSGLAIQFVRVTLRTGSPLAALWRMSLFFTDIANATTAIVFTLIALGAVRLRHPLLTAGLALAMLLVGLVFELFLRRLVDLSGWRLVNNVLLHDVVPLLTAGAWLALAEKGRLRSRDPWIIALFPILYLGWALLRGRLGGTYPYPFLDGPSIGWGHVALWVAGIAAAFLVTAYALVALDRWLAGRRG